MKTTSKCKDLKLANGIQKENDRAQTLENNLGVVWDLNLIIKRLVTPKLILEGVIHNCNRKRHEIDKRLKNDKNCKTTVLKNWHNMWITEYIRFSQKKKKTNWIYKIDCCHLV